MEKIYEIYEILLEEEFFQKYILQRVSYIKIVKDEYLSITFFNKEYIRIYEDYILVYRDGKLEQHSEYSSYKNYEQYIYTIFDLIKIYFNIARLD